MLEASLVNSELQIAVPKLLAKHATNDVFSLLVVGLMLALSFLVDRK